MKEKIIIKREWNNSEIKIQFTKDDVSISANVDDFAEAFISNVPNMKWDFNEKNIKDKVKKAFELTVKQMKEETKKAL